MAIKLAELQKWQTLFEGEWRVYIQKKNHHEGGRGEILHHNDTAFIQAAVEAFPLLLMEVFELRAENIRLNTILDGLPNTG